MGAGRRREGEGREGEARGDRHAIDGFGDAQAGTLIAACNNSDGVV